MKKLTLLLISVFLLAGFNLQAQDMSLDEILDEHFETIGQKKLLKINNQVITGKISQMGMELPFKIIQQRPDKFYLEADVQGSLMQQVYNGETGWIIAPMMGSTEPVDITGPDLDNMKQQADMDGYLWNWKERGLKCELVGKEDMEGSEVYNIKLTKENGGIDNYYIDAENFVILKTKTKVTQMGSEVEQETYLSNYKPVGGIVIPFNMEIRSSGMVVATMVLEEVLIDQDIDDSIFVKPVTGQ